MRRSVCINGFKKKLFETNNTLTISDQIGFVFRAVVFQKWFNLVNFSFTENDSTEKRFLAGSNSMV